MTTTPYGQWALSDELGKLSRAVEGARNHTLNTVWFKLTQLVDAGHLDHDNAHERVFTTARQVGLPDSEIRATMASAGRGGQTKARTDVPDPTETGRPDTSWLDLPRRGAAPLADTETSTSDTDEDDKKPEPPPGLPDEFWQKRPTLDHIRQAAWSRGRSAEAVLGVVLARMAADTLHGVKLPASVGARCGLSFITALTGPPGSGKSSSKSIAVELIPAQIIKEDCDDVPPGSGEGLIELLFDYDEDADTGKKTKRQLRNNVFTYADEGEVLAVQARRNSSNTILPIIRTVFTDGTLGQANASIERKRRVPSGTYAYGIVLGIQPEKADNLFEDAGGGTPQRFLWSPTNTPVPPPTDRPEWPGPIDRPNFNDLRHDLDNVGPSGNRYHFTIDPTVEAELRNNDHQKQQHGCDPLDEHADLIQLKVAGILAVLDGRLHISAQDWQLARMVRDNSNATRTWVLALLANQRQKANKARGHAKAEQESIVETTQIDNALSRASKAIMRKLDRVGDEGATRKPLHDVCGKDRDHFEPAIEGLIEFGMVDVDTTGRAPRYRRTGGPQP